MSMATMLMSMTQHGCSRMSVSFFTKATAEMHWENIWIIGKYVN